MVYERYGTPDNLSLREVNKPVPADDEVLVKVCAASINKADFYMLAGRPFMIRLAGYGLLKPKNTILGADIAGRVEAAGKNVKEFKPGDDVYGDIFDRGFGALAEYVCAKESVIAPKPAKLTYEEAAAVPLAGVTALKGLKNLGQVKPGMKVLINGASGGVGTFAVQIAKALGAEVTAVCSTGNVGMARSIGADYVVDYKKEDFTKSGKSYDLILGANGYHKLSEYLRALSPEGTYVMAGGTMAQIFQAMLLGQMAVIGTRKNILALASSPEKKALLFLSGLIEAGKVKPVIDRRFPLAEAAEAFRYLGEGHAKAKVVITIGK